MERKIVPEEDREGGEKRRKQIIHDRWLPLFQGEMTGQETCGNGIEAGEKIGKSEIADCVSACKSTRAGPTRTHGEGEAKGKRGGKGKEKEREKKNGFINLYYYLSSLTLEKNR